MAREHENFRPMLEQLNRAFPEKEFLKPVEIAQFIGCSRHTVDRRYRQYYKEGIGISKVQLARLLC